MAVSVLSIAVSPLVCSHRTNSGRTRAEHPFARYLIHIILDFILWNNFVNIVSEMRLRNTGIASPIHLSAAQHSPNESIVSKNYNILSRKPILKLKNTEYSVHSLNTRLKLCFALR